MRHKLRVGIAGIGPHMLEHLLPALWLQPGIQVVAAVSSSAPKRQALSRDLWIPKWFDSLEGLLGAGGCDGVVVSGSVAYHERALAACIERSLPIFVEKPPASSLAGLFRLAEAARSAGAVVGVGLNLPRTEIVARIGQHLDQSATSVRSLKIDYHTNKPKSPLWNLETLLESFLLAIAIHPLSLALHFLGQGMVMTDHQIRDRDGTVSLRIALRGDGGVAEVFASNGAARHSCDFELGLANRERLHARGLRTLARAGEDGEELLWEPGPLAASLNGNGFLREIGNFIDQARAHRPNNELQDAIPIYAVLDRFLKAAG